MEYKNLKEDIKSLVDNELSSARSKFKNMNSAHEGYAILLEEFEEFKEEVDFCENDIKSLWNSVKKDDKAKQLECIDSTYDVCQRMIKEAIQLAAMCKRLKEDVLVDKDI